MLQLSGKLTIENHFACPIAIKSRSKPCAEFTQAFRLYARKPIQRVGDLKEGPRHQLPGPASRGSILTACQEIIQIPRRPSTEEPAQILDERLGRRRQLLIEEGKNGERSALDEVERAAPGKVVRREGPHVAREIHPLLLGLVSVGSAEPRGMPAKSHNDRRPRLGGGNVRERLCQTLLIVARLLFAR